MIEAQRHHQPEETEQKGAQRNLMERLRKRFSRKTEEGGSHTAIVEELVAKMLIGAQLFSHTERSGQLPTVEDMQSMELSSEQVASITGGVLAELKTKVDTLQSGIQSKKESRSFKVLESLAFKTVQVLADLTDRPPNPEFIDRPHHIENNAGLNAMLLNKRLAALGSENFKKIQDLDPEALGLFSPQEVRQLFVEGSAESLQKIEQIAVKAWNKAKELKLQDEFDGDWAVLESKHDVGDIELVESGYGRGTYLFLLLLVLLPLLAACTVGQVDTDNLSATVEPAAITLTLTPEELEAIESDTWRSDQILTRDPRDFYPEAEVSGDDGPDPDPELDDPDPTPEPEPSPTPNPTVTVEATPTLEASEADPEIFRSPNPILVEINVNPSTQEVWSQEYLRDVFLNEAEEESADIFKQQVDFIEGQGGNPFFVIHIDADGNTSWNILDLRDGTVQLYGQETGEGTALAYTSMSATETLNLDLEERQENLAIAPIVVPQELAVLLGQELTTALAVDRSADNPASFPFVSLVDEEGKRLAFIDTTGYVFTVDDEEPGSKLAHWTLTEEGKERALHALQEARSGTGAMIDGMLYIQIDGELHELNLEELTIPAGVSVVGIEVNRDNVPFLLVTDDTTNQTRNIELSQVFANDAETPEWLAKLMPEEPKPEPETYANADGAEYTSIVENPFYDYFNESFAVWEDIILAQDNADEILTIMEEDGLYSMTPGALLVVFEDNTSIFAARVNSFDSDAEPSVMRISIAELNENLSEYKDEDGNSLVATQFVITNQEEAVALDENGKVIAETKGKEDQKFIFHSTEGALETNRILEAIENEESFAPNLIVDLTSSSIHASNIETNPLDAQICAQIIQNLNIEGSNLAVAPLDRRENILCGKVLSVTSHQYGHSVQIQTWGMNQEGKIAPIIVWTGFTQITGTEDELSVTKWDQEANNYGRTVNSVDTDAEFASLFERHIGDFVLMPYFPAYADQSNRNNTWSGPLQRLLSPHHPLEERPEYNSNTAGSATLMGRGKVVFPDLPATAATQ